MIYAKKDNKEILRQLEITNPDVIFCGYTLSLFKTAVSGCDLDDSKTNNELKLDNVQDKMFGFWCYRI